MDRENIRKAAAVTDVVLEGLNRALQALRAAGLQRRRRVGRPRHGQAEFASVEGWPEERDYE